MTRLLPAAGYTVVVASLSLSIWSQLVSSSWSLKATLLRVPPLLLVAPLAVEVEAEDAVEGGPAWKLAEYFFLQMWLSKFNARLSLVIDWFEAQFLY